MRLKVVLLGMVMIPYAAAQVQASFENRMYALERLDVSRPNPFVNLNTGERHALVSCRDTLVAVFKGLSISASLR